MSEIVYAKKEDLERLVLAYTPKFRAILEASRKQVEAGDAIGHAEFWEQVEGESRRERPRRKRARVAELSISRKI
jgi:hypothetical protein